MRDTAPPAAGHGQGTGMRWVRSIRRVPGVQGVPPSGSGQAKTRRRGATDVSLPSGALLYIEGVRCSAVRRSVGFRSDTPRTSLISINACGWRSRFTIDRPRVPRRPPRRALPRGYPQNAAYPQPAMACRTALRVLRPCIAAMMSDFQLPRMGTRLRALHGVPSAPCSCTKIKGNFLWDGRFISDFSCRFGMGQSLTALDGVGERMNHCALSPVGSDSPVGATPDFHKN